jgi:hypothetical protein
MLDALVHGQDGQVAGAGQPARAEQGGQAFHDRHAAVRGDEDPVHEVRAGQVQGLLGDGAADVPEQIFGVGPEQ